MVRIERQQIDRPSDGIILSANRDNVVLQRRPGPRLQHGSVSHQLEPAHRNPGHYELPLCIRLDWGSYQDGYVAHSSVIWLVEADDDALERFVGVVQHHSADL